MTFSLPPKLASFACIEQRVHHRLHTLRVRRVGLHKVDEVKPIRLVLPRVLYSEVEPLGEALRAVVIFEIQIVLKWSDLDAFPQIATLEARFKDERLVRRQVTLLAIVVVGSAHLISTGSLISRVNLWRYWRTLLIVGIFFDFWIDSIVRL